MGAALSGATTAAAAPPRSGAPEGPTSFFDTGTMMRPRFGVGDAEAEGDDDEDVADATIVAERRARIMFAGIVLGEGGRRLLGRRRRLGGIEEAKSRATTASDKKTRTGISERKREENFS